MMTDEEMLDLLIAGMKREAALIKRVADDLRDGPDMAAAYEAYAESLEGTNANLRIERDT